MQGDVLIAVCIKLNPADMSTLPGIGPSLVTQATSVFIVRRQLCLNGNSRDSDGRITSRNGIESLTGVRSG